MGNKHSYSAIELRRNWVARLLLPGPLVYIASAGLLIRPRKTAPGFLLSYDDIVKVTAQRGWLWDTIIVTRGNNADPVVMQGVRHCQAPIIDAPSRAAKSSKALPLLGMLKQIASHEAFVSAYDDECLKACHAKAEGDVRALSVRIRAGVVEDSAWQVGLPALAFEESFDAYSSRPRTEWNDKFVAAEIVRIGPWVKKRFPNPLTDEQLKAIVTAEDNQLVVAGAGTGKTTTVLGKIAYLVEVKKTPPERILAIAFNKDAAAEIRARVEKFGIPVTAAPSGTGVVASTYHALGGNLVHEVSNAVRKKISQFDEDPLARENFIRSKLLELFRAPKTHADVRDFLAYYSTPVGDAREYPSYEAYVQSDSAANLRTLKGGRLVKSHGERVIANWLYLHGLEYEYEQQFAFPKGNPQNQRYQPDFAVASPRGPIYIEYYGLDEKEQTAPGIDRAGYLKTRDWKRKLHQSHETTCVELSYAQLKTGDLFAALSSQLNKLLCAPDLSPNGGGKVAPLKAIPLEEVEKLFVAGKDGRSSELDAVIKLLYRFLTLYRSNLWALNDIEGRMPGAREQAFLRVFKLVLREYLGALTAAGETDFAGLIADAVPLCSKWSRAFDYIIVDEFQDISRGRELFLLELLKLSPGRRFCAVGDDWQSIYRFTGSDVSVMTSFKYGSTARTDLQRSFRFNESLLELSSRFIQKNPAQLKKKLIPQQDSNHRSVYLWEYDDALGDDDALQRACLSALKDYRQRFKPAKPEVLFLSRYRRGVAAIKKDVLPELADGFEADTLTVHRSKGLEADCVIVQVQGGRMGFPCASEDDPLIRCVLTDPDDFPNAEERRLFYVALTRAKTCVYIVASKSVRSVFVSELLEDFASDTGTRLMVDLSSADAKKVHRCPICRGHVVGRVASGENFWSCENSPACYFTTQECTACKKAPLLPSREKSGHAVCAACGDASTRFCPACKLGVLVKRMRRADGKPFWACSFFAKTGCSFTADGLPGTA